METPRLDLSHYAAHWDLELEPAVQHMPAATIACGYQRGQAIVLKLRHPSSDEYRAASALRHFAAEGAVRCIDAFEEALLLERLIPGTPLTRHVVRGEDDHAMRILCRVMRKLHACSMAAASQDFPGVEQWGASLRQYLQGEPHPLLPVSLVAMAEHVYTQLCHSQGQRRLLHGDLHHDNILFDQRRGWLAIDPKGVVGEAEYEIGAALRNPTADTALYADPAIIARRLAIAASELSLDRQRMAGWCFAQAILSSVWAVEDALPAAAIWRGRAVAQASLPQLCAFSVPPAPDQHGS